MKNNLRTLIKRSVMGVVMFAGGIAFGQQTYTFTNCSATGSLGPTQSMVNTAYPSSNSLYNAVTVNSTGIQSWTVPASAGNVKIEVWGARGGTASAGTGNGAYAAGIFNLTPGTVLNILVGQMGLSGTNQYWGGGGGGTYVVLGNNTPLIVAGGGGGGYYNSYSGGSSNAGGTITTSGNPGGYNTSGTNGTGGSSGNGGTASTNAGAGGCGGGLLTNGGNGSSGGSGGLAFVNGGTGGAPNGTNYGGEGGFGGGGGSSSNSSYGSGGGGGYSGGAGGASYGCGGGGGSYSAGTSNTFVANTNTTMGRVVITELCSISLDNNIAVSNTVNICSGTSVTLSTNAASNYSWSTGATTSSIVVSPTVTTTYSVAGTSTASCNSSRSMTIIVSQGAPALTVASSASATSNSVCPNRSITITGTTTTSGQTTYTVAPGQQNGVAFLPANQVYTVSASNICGTSSSVVAVSILTVPTITTAVSVNSLCSGSSVTLIATGNFTNFAWSSGSNNGAGYYPTTTQAYTVTGTTAQGCTATAVSPVVTVVTTPMNFPSINPPLICIGGSSTLTASGAANYTWTGPGGNTLTPMVIVTPTQTTTYTVVKANGVCQDIVTVTITVNQLPSILASANPPVSCSGKQVALSGFGSGSNSSYTWQPQNLVLTVSGNTAVNPTISTIYTLTVSDGTCKNTAQVSVTVNPNPVISFSPATSATMCYGSSASFTAGGGINYTVASTQGTLNIPVVANQTPTQTTSYTITTDNVYNCTTTAIYPIVVYTLPAISTTVNPQTVCVAGTATLKASGTHTYSWSNSSQNPSTTVNPLSTSIYTVTGTNTVTTCQNTKTVVVNVFDPTLAVSGSTSACLGGSVTLNGLGADTYTWNGNYFFPSFTGAPPGPTVYVVQGAFSHSSGITCYSTKSIPISIYNNPTITATSSRSLVCKGDDFQLKGDGANTYTWSVSQFSTIIGGTVTVNLQKQTTFTVVGVDLHGCSGDTVLTVKVSNCDGIHSNALSAQVRVYPNPAHGTFRVESDGDMNLQILTELGQKVRDINLTDSNNHQLDVSDLPVGIYFVKGQKDGENFATKLIIN